MIEKVNPQHPGKVADGGLEKFDDRPTMKFYCNHCGKELDPDTDHIDYDIEFDEFSYNVDLCAKCKTKLVNAIDIIITRYVRGAE